MKKFFAILLAACLLLTQGSFAASAAVPAGEGAAFTVDELWNKFGDDMYYTEKNFETIFHTVEAWVYFDSTCSTANGVMLGNYDQSGNTFINVGVQAGHPRVNYIDGAGNSYNVRFDTVSVINGKWTHMVLVNDPETHQIHCYIDGELAETKGFFPDFDQSSADQSFVVGGDLRRLNTDYFKGGLKELNVYADVRTAEEIKNDYLSAKVDIDEDLLASWDFSGGKANADIADRSSYQNGLIYSNQWLTEEEAAALHDPDFERAYSFAVVGDTQMVTLHAPDQLTKIYDWILANQKKENIQYAIGLGDITDTNTLAEWKTAYTAITKMNGKLPYSVIRGNHDMLRAEGNVHDDSGINYFDQYFLNDTAYAAQFNGATGGKYQEDSVFNTWTAFSPEGSDADWLILSLDYMPSDEVLDWAAGIVEAHPDHKVIIATHYFLDSSGAITNASASPIWERLASKYENIELVLSGHVYSDHVKVSHYEGANGNTVTGVLINPQGPDRTLTGTAYNTTGVGAVALFHFNKEGTELQVEYYSTIQERYWKTNSQITIDLTEGALRETKLDTWNGQLSAIPAGTGTEADPYLVESAANLLWMSEQVTKKSAASLTNKYFKQTADIDLAGIGIPSIGYYYNTTTDMAAFGGHYDGQGYAIKNGSILANSAAFTAASFTREYGYGLFGCIYGATIENVHLENVTINGMGTTGGIVGKAAAPSTGSGTAAFNTIQNCSVDETSSIAPIMNTLTVSEEVAYDNLYRAGMVGGICGVARSATIQNCSSAMKIVIPGTFTHAGGIAASIGYNAAVDHCVFTGSIEVMDDSSAQTLSIGGIVGITSPGNATTDVGDALPGTIRITNCVNRGTLFTSVDDLTAGNHWGGILGFAGNLPTLTTEETYPFYMENCYNLTALDVQPHLETAVENAWARGLVGKAQVNSNSESLFLKNCYSVLTDSGVEANSTSLSNTNEFRNQWTNSETGNYCVVALDGTVGTKSAGELLAAVLEIEKALPTDEVTVVSGDWEYVANEEGITLTAYKGTADAIEIPAALDGLSVAALGEGLFLNTPLTALYIPDGITAIEMGAFYGTGITEVSIPKNATVGTDAFGADTTVDIVNISGDVNGDDTADLIDALLLLRKMSGNLTEAQEAVFNLRAANVYDAEETENEVNSADIIRMLQVINGAWEDGKPVTLTRSAADPAFVAVG